MTDRQSLPRLLHSRDAAKLLGVSTALRIPIEAGHGFRSDVGHRSGLKAATVPI